MALLTTVQFLEHFDTDLGTDALQRLLDDAEADIVRLFGAHATQVDYRLGDGVNIWLSRPASSITQVVETVGDTETTLAANDYKTLFGGRQLERDPDGTNGRTTWGERVKVTYVPEDDTARRRRVQLDLVKLAIQYEGLDSVRVGNVSSQQISGNYQQRRSEILSALAPTFGFY